MGSFHERAVTIRQFLYSLLPVFLVLLMSETTADPDLWGHVRFGLDMIDHGSIWLNDSYSFTADRAWVNHEWLAEIAMASAFRRAGPAGLNLLRLAIIAGVLVIVWHAASRLSWHQRVVLTALGTIGIYMRVLPIRPQLFSLVFFAALLALLDRADDRRTMRPLYLVPALMALWVNLHGGWIVGFGVLGLWLTLSLPSATHRERIVLLAVIAAAGLATLVNPYGARMWAFLGETVRLSRPRIHDWQPLYALPAHVWISWATAAALSVFTVIRSRGSLDIKRLAIVSLLAVMAVRVSRLDAFFAIAALFFAIGGLKRQTSAAAVPVDSDRRRPALAYAFYGCAALVVIAAIPRVMSVPARSDLIPDTHVSAYVRDQKLSGNVLVWFDWGEYSIWHFGPALKVSIDGRRETVYSEALVDAHMTFYFGADDQWKFADVIKADYVWIPRQLPVARGLRENGWTPLCEGESSILLSRRPVARRCAVEQATHPRAFPDL